MEKILVYLGMMAATVLAISSCKCNPTFDISVGNSKSVHCKGDVEVREMGLSGFNQIMLNGAADINLTQGDAFRVTVTANNEVFEYLNYKVEDGVLILETKDNVTIKAQTYDVAISLPALVSVVVNGAGDIDLKSGYTGEEDLSMVINGAGDFDFSGIRVPTLSVVVNGAGDIDLNDIDVQRLSVSVNGAGDATVTGKADKASFSVSGVGGINATGLDAGEVKTSKSGVASIKTK
jgi:hypothetical protein